MPISFEQSVAIIVVTAIFTFITRLIPFAIFGNRPVPQVVNYLGKALPPAVIIILIVYSIKDTNFTQFPSLLPQLIAIGIVIVLHLWRKNNLLSIGGGTICYMILSQVIFKI